jgi:hypothetical protein
VKVAPSLPLGSLALTLVTLLTAAAYAGAKHGCPDCCCTEPPKRVCRVVSELRTVTTYQYFTRPETICLPGRSRCLVTEPTTECEPGHGTSGCTPAPKVWVPTAGPTVCRSLLCRRPVTVQKLCHKYIVEDVCRGCGHAEIDRASTEALQYARGLPPDGWQPVDEPPSLIARHKPARSSDKSQTAKSESKSDVQLTSGQQPLPHTH